MIAARFQSSRHFRLGPFNETWGLFTEGQQAGLPARDPGMGASHVSPRQATRSHAAGGGQFRRATTIMWKRTSIPGTLIFPATRGKIGWIKLSHEPYPGSTWNFIGGRKQGDQPLFNSECGNVWGYEGSTGDVDWSWDYHIMMNEFRMHPKICRLALHGTSRCDQRMERLLPFRPLRKIHRTGFTRARHEVE